MGSSTLTIRGSHILEIKTVRRDPWSDVAQQVVEIWDGHTLIAVIHTGVEDAQAMMRALSEEREK